MQRNGPKSPQADNSPTGACKFTRASYDALDDEQKDAIQAVVDALHGDQVYDLSDPTQCDDKTLAGAVFGPLARNARNDPQRRARLLYSVYGAAKKLAERQTSDITPDDLLSFVQSPDNKSISVIIHESRRGEWSFYFSDEAQAWHHGFTSFIDLAIEVLVLADRFVERAAALKLRRLRTG